MKSDDLQKELQAMRAASAPGEMRPRDEDRSLGWHMWRHVRKVVLFSLLFTVAMVAALLIWQWLNH